MLNRASKQTRCGLPRGFHLQQTVLTYPQAQSQNEERRAVAHSKHCPRKKDKVCLEENEDWAKVATYSSRTELDGNHISFVRGDFVD